MNIDSRRRKIDHGQALLSLRISYLPTSKLVTVSHLPLSRAMPFVDIERICFLDIIPSSYSTSRSFVIHCGHPPESFLSFPFWHHNLRYSPTITNHQMALGIRHSDPSNLRSLILLGLHLIRYNIERPTAGAKVCNCLSTTTVCSLSL